MRRIEPGLIVLLFVAGCTPAPQPQLPDPGSQGAALVMANCTECHGAPMPSVHPAKEWAGVLRRMQNWRTTKGMGPIPEKDVAPLLEYLKSHGRAE
ncbi:MAG: hypothetical protein K2P57_01305 [Burkholderiales bacterium]|nr:hypothetical protein [Burkholderiales bacterium]